MHIRHCGEGPVNTRDVLLSLSVEVVILGEPAAVLLEAYKQETAGDQMRREQNPAKEFENAHKRKVEIQKDLDCHEHSFELNQITQQL